MKDISMLMKLNLGAGTTRNKDWSTLDLIPSSGLDFIGDLNSCNVNKLPIDDNSCSHMRMEHTLEHITNVLPLFDELYRIAKADCALWITCPYGFSEDAWADPTHIRPIIHRTFIYFSQPKYYAFDYGYRGDWQAESFYYILHEKISIERINSILHSEKENFIHKLFRNEPELVSEIGCYLRAIKPARERDKKLLRRPKIFICRQPFDHVRAFAKA